MALEPISIDIDNRETRRRMLRFRMLLAMRGARIVTAEHDHVTIECRKGDEHSVRELAREHGIILDGVS